MPHLTHGARPQWAEPLNAWPVYAIPGTLEVPAPAPPPPSPGGGDIAPIATRGEFPAFEKAIERQKHLARLKRDDNELLELISVMLTEGILN